MKTRYSELIEKYVNDELSKEEIDLFHEKLKVDTELQNEFRLEQEVSEAINDDEVIDFRKQISEVRSAMPISENNRNEQNRLLSVHQNSSRWLLLAASVLIIAGLAIYYMLKQSTNLNSELYSEFYNPYPAEISERGDSVHLSLFSQGLELYNKRDFKAAREQLIQVVSNEPDHVQASLYLGISYIELDSSAQALNCFNRIIEAGNNPFVLQAKWYIIMVLLKKNDTTENEKIRNYCNEIIMMNSDKTEESKLIISKLK